MKSKKWFLIAFIFVIGTQVSFTQNVPREITNYLGKHYSGWKLSPSRKECSEEVNRGFISSDFSGDGKKDYALKFTGGKKGFILAFVRNGRGFKPFVLHNYAADDANTEALSVQHKGSIFEVENKKLKLKHDAVRDYFCESDVGGIHYYQNGKFVGY